MPLENVVSLERCSCVPGNLFVANRNHGRDCIIVKGNISDFYVVKDSNSDREDQKEIDDAEIDACVKGLASWGHG
jgi:hypothetical protein